MKKILLLLLTVAFFTPSLTAQDCDCGKVNFSITNWICKGKDAAGNPIYEGTFKIENNTKCKFTLTEMFQQTPGDVTVTLPIVVPPLGSYSTTIVYTDVPPHAPPGSTPYFIVVYNLDDKKCKFEFPSDKIPTCDQSCTCSDDGWLTFVATIGGISQKVECGHQFGLSCKDTITLKGEYLCKGSCTAKYTAVLVDAITNTVIQNYPSFSFPWIYQFPSGGSYYLEITPICGDTKCQPCRFYFTVRDCPNSCDCNVDGWQPFTATIGGVTQTVTCGWQFGLCKDTVTLRGEYKCKGDCEAKYSAVLVDAITNTVIATYPNFSFPWVYPFNTPGNYYLVITPKCGDKECQPCRFYFTVRDCPTTCECNTNGWQPFTAWVNNDSLAVRCGHQFGVVQNSTVRLLGNYPCVGNCTAKYVAVLKNSVTNTIIQTWNPVIWPWSYTFTAEGNYQLEITPICGNKKCQPCVFYFTVRRPVI
jgi:hypothetical protein